MGLLGRNIAHELVVRAGNCHRRGFGDHPAAARLTQSGGSFGVVRELPDRLDECCGIVGRHAHTGLRRRQEPRNLRAGIDRSDHGAGRRQAGIRLGRDADVAQTGPQTARRARRRRPAPRPAVRSAGSRRIVCLPSRPRRPPSEARAAPSPFTTNVISGHRRAASTTRSRACENPTLPAYSTTGSSPIPSSVR